MINHINCPMHLAIEIGLEEGIMLTHLNYWIEHNKANNTNYHDGYYWTYNSTSALADLFPIWNAKKIERILKSLLDQDLLKTGNYNKSTYDRTKWYALTEKAEALLNNTPIQNKEIDKTNMHNALDKNAKSIGQNVKIHSTEMSNGLVENVEPIPEYNTENNTEEEREQHAQTTPHQDILHKPPNPPESKPPSPPEHKPPAKFIPPTASEVENYFAKLGAGGKTKKMASDFMDYYTEYDWKDKNRRPVKDWQARARRWFNNDANFSRPEKPVRDGSIFQKVPLFEQIRTNQASLETPASSYYDDTDCLLLSIGGKQ